MTTLVIDVPLVELPPSPNRARGDDMLTWPTRIAKDRLVVNMTVPGDPLSKGRPRFAMNKNGSVYTPRETREAEDLIGWQIKAAHHRLVPDADHAFGIRLFFFTKTYQRRDIDNMTKLVFDACTGIVWADDCQVSEMIARVERADPNPRTELVIYHLGVVSRPTVKCEVCGASVPTYPSWKLRRYCSRRCSSLAARNGDTSPCLNCGKPVHRPAHQALMGQHQYCDQTCRNARLRMDKACAVCGKAFTVQRAIAERRFTCSRACGTIRARRPR